jgi:hypothetical protein
MTGCDPTMWIATVEKVSFSSDQSTEPVEMKRFIDAQNANAAIDNIDFIKRTRRLGNTPIG